MKKFLVAALLLLMVGSTSLAFAWWDRLEQGADNQTLDMGYGVRLELNDQNTGDKVLVPAGSFYAAVDGYTTEYVFTYELNLEEDLDNFDLLIAITDLKIGGIDYNKAANVHGPLNVVITSSAIDFSDTIITSDETNLRLNGALVGKETVTFNVTFTLNDQAFEYDEEVTEEDLVAAYKALAGQKISFDIAFAIPSHADQTGNFNVHTEATQPE